MKPTRGAPALPVPVDKIDAIAEAFGMVYTIKRAAGLMYLSPYHLQKWLEQGADDSINNILSNDAQLFYKVSRKLSEKAAQLLSMVEACPKNYGAAAWVLEKCFREDYGMDSAEHKELMELYQKLLDNFKRLSNQPQGVLEHGELDSEGN